jgi:hypothetical protein
VLPRESRHVRQERRNRRRTDLAALERLEPRELLAFTTLGFSLPQLVVSGEAGPRAAWGGPLDVSVFLQNIGSSTTTEPTAQAPGDTSQADAGDSTIEVVLTPHAHSFKGAVVLGTIDAPPVSQNNLEQLTDMFTLPSRPSGFKSSGGKFYVRFIANANGAILQANPGHGNISTAVPVSLVARSLPELRATALYVPDVMQPGDTISPTITVENLGTADTDLQAPVQVALVASVTPTFTLGSSIVALYTIGNIPAVSQTPTAGDYQTFAQNIVDTPPNSVTFTGAPVTLPTTPGTYYLGVVVDPYGKINELSLPSNVFSLIHKVGPGNTGSGLPPAGVVNSAGNTGAFPIAPNGQIIGNV